MSEKTDFFDEIIDEKTVEKISEDYPVLSDEEKDRIFSIVERKLNIDKVVNSDHGEEVSGVEGYIRPRWMNIISIAASAAVLFGGIGSSVCLMHNMKPGASDEPTPEVVDEIETSPTENPFVSVKPSIAAENKNDPVQKTKKAVEDQLAEKTGKTKDNKNQSNAVAAVSLNNNVQSASEQLNDTVTDADASEAENNESQVIVQADVPVTTTVVTTEYEVIQTTAVQSTDENGKLQAAESLIAEYGSIRDIIDMNVPFIDDSVITVKREVRTPYSDAVGYKLLLYKQVDPDVYADMQAMKEHFYYVMCSSRITDDIFGPEFNSELCPEGIVYDFTCPEYSYITYDGTLYELMGQNTNDKMQMVDEPAVIYNVNEYGFTAAKNFKHPDDNSIITVRFGIVRDYSANKWAILSVVED